MNSGDKQLKNKVFLYIILIGITMFVLFLSLSYFDYNEKMRKQFEIKTKELKTIIQTEEQRIIKLYRSRLQKNLKSYGVIDAIKNNQREKLYSLIKPRYDELLKENKNFKAMHFHTKDNKSFLRMHKPTKYGDDLSSFRQIVVDTNSEKKAFDGFEKGKYGYFYRIILPIIEEENHLGSVEFGLELEYFLENLRRLTPSTNFGLLLDGELIIDYNSFFTPIRAKIDLNKEYQILSIMDETYIVSSNIYIKDYKGNDTIKILFAMDVTEYKKEILDEVIYLIFLGIVSYIISIFIINGAFRKYILSIEKQSKQLRENSQIINDYIIVSATDLEGIITYASDAFCKISGYTKEELIGRPHNIIRHKDSKKETFEVMWNTIRQGKVWNGEIKNKKKDGGYYWVNAYVSPNFDEDGKIIGYTAIRQDITDKKIIEKISQTDKLTGVYNRLKLDETLEFEIERAKRYKTPLSIILVDIDKFKQVNDNFGHLIGDDVLIQTTKILQKHLRKTDILGRWGGEEFLIICSQIDKYGAATLAESLREAIEEFEFDTVKKITGSFGVAEYENDEELDKLLKRCDDALYSSKGNGRNKVTLL